MSPQANEQLSRHYEREAEATRRSLANNLSELQRHLSPGQVFDEVLTYAKDGGGSFARAFSSAVRANPFPALMIGTGCMMFLAEKMGISRTTTSARYVGPRDMPGMTGADQGSGIADKAKETASRATATIKEGIAAVGDKVRDASARTRETAHDLRDSVTETVEDLKQGSQSVGGHLAETAVHARHQATTAARQVKDRAWSFIHEQPVLAAGIGLAIGAALAALLPSTKTEDRLMGERSDSIKKRIGDTASQQFQTAKQTAGEFVERAGDALEREGLTASGAAAEVVNRVTGSERQQEREGSS
jgi:ElaB/YqjD/DUF883 family membrane-anchored ribosome-binding protein